MTLPIYPNQISAANVRLEFLTGTGSLSFNSLHRSDAGPVYTGTYAYPKGTSTPTAPPSSGMIALSDFHGASRYIPMNQTVTLNAGSGTWTVPSTLIGNLTIKAFGGGGGGAIWPSGSAGGAGGGGAKFVGSIPRGTSISYKVASGGLSHFGDSTRYARDPGDTQFGVSGQSWYMYIPGLGVGAFNMVGERRGPGTGSTAQGASGITLGTGGNGSPERTSNPGYDATTIGGGGGGCAWSTGGAGGGGYGADGGGYGGGPAQNGVWPAGGGGGWNGAYPGQGADGAIIITGRW